LDALGGDAAETAVLADVDLAHGELGRGKRLVFGGLDLGWCRM